MTEQELIEKFDIKVHIFDESDLGDEGEAFYIPDLRTIFISNKIPAEHRVKIILHELGHEGHFPHLYPIFREKYELQANRNMIHHLLKDAVSNLENCRDFDYLKFMEHYNLKTTADEIMVKEEYLSLLNDAQ